MSMFSSPDLSPSRVIANGNFLATIIRAVIAQAPRSHLRRLAVSHADNHIAIPRPGMLAIILAGPRWMIRMRMIPAYDVQFLFPGGFLRIAHVFGGDRKAIVRGILAAVHQREQRQDLAERWLHTARCRSPVANGAVATQESPAAFVRIGLRAVLANFLRDFRAHLQCWSCCHGSSSSQKRSLRYFAPESANTVTMTACCSRA